jgi:hypothetical protein
MKRFIEYISEDLGVDLEDEDQILEAMSEKEQLDEGILQRGFNFMWNLVGATKQMYGKIPAIEKSRAKKEHARFKQKMTPQVVDQWMQELHAKVKSEHPLDIKAREKRIKHLKVLIDNVIAAPSPEQYIKHSAILKRELDLYQMYIKSANRPTPRSGRPTPKSSGESQ